MMEYVNVVTNIVDYQTLVVVKCSYEIASLDNTEAAGEGARVSADTLSVPES